MSRIRALVRPPGEAFREALCGLVVLVPPPP